MVLVSNKKQFIAELKQALERREDTQIELASNGAFMHIKGVDSIEREIVNTLKWFRRSSTYAKMTEKQRAKEELYRTKDLRKRLDNPVSIVNRFKKTPAAMWA